ncbi:hypothetical protein B296_00043173 [Ensete ventricosum]|uniref:Uncharacterized protein n=1 Tax=Ensete ventricosum TaxID=4639 RepID=A0A426XA56_ENSVE|nr:hypothetical protein B296_00043173 [Ensete ventricosum]
MEKSYSEFIARESYTTQQEEEIWIQGVNVMVPQRRVFVCASKLVLDESLKQPELDCFSAHIHLREPDKFEDKAKGGSTDCEGRDEDAR